MICARECIFISHYVFMCLCKCMLVCAHVLVCVCVFEKDREYFVTAL